MTYSEQLLSMLSCLPTSIKRNISRRIFDLVRREMTQGPTATFVDNFSEMAAIIADETRSYGSPSEEGWGPELKIASTITRSFLSEHGLEEAYYNHNTFRASVDSANQLGLTPEEGVAFIIKSLLADNESLKNGLTDWLKKHQIAITIKVDK